MKLWDAIKKIDWIHTMGFVGLLLKRPILAYPIYRATQHTLSIVNGLYGKDHFRSGPANAFRHAYWNVCLCVAIYKKTKDRTAALSYCEEIVNYYEKATKNLPMEHSMDFHNNEIGRKVFFQNLNEKDEKLIKIIQKMTKTAIKIDSLEDFDKHQDSLVYLEKDNSRELLHKKEKQ